MTCLRWTITGVSKDQVDRATMICHRSCYSFHMNSLRRSRSRGSSSIIRDLDLMKSNLRNIPQIIFPWSMVLSKNTWSKWNKSTRIQLKTNWLCRAIARWKRRIYKMTMSAGHSYLQCIDPRICQKWAFLLHWICRQSKRLAPSSSCKRRSGVSRQTRTWPLI